jgi:fructokinase
LGKDELGDEFLKVLRSKKVDVETEGCVQRVEGRPTRDVYVVYTKSGDREFVGFGEKTPTEGYADCFIDPSKLPTGLISSAGALVTGTLGLAYPQTAEAMRRAVGVARGARVPVIVDVNWRPVFFEKPESEATKDEIREYVLASADVVKLSDEEAEWLFGVKAAEALKDPEEVLRRLLGGGGEKGSGSSSSPSPSSSSVGVLVTGGGLGASYSFLTPEGKNATSGFLPALEVAATDTTGAGDAFLGGFLVSLLDAGGLGALRSDPEKLRGAVAFAAAAGAATTTAPGAIAAQPGREAVERLLNK